MDVRFELGNLNVKEAVEQVLKEIADHLDVLRRSALSTSMGQNTIKQQHYYEGVASANQNAALFIRQIKVVE